jgi:4-hydroxy-4-methyl-2-oxoglutarate aldolase
MDNYRRFEKLSPTFFADVLAIENVMDHGIRPLWPDMKRIAGPAYTVRCAPGDQLMLHAAIYRAEPGSIIVVQAGDCRSAVCGGNVCAIAQQRGIAGFIVDGVVRDIGESRENGFPLFARGVSPKPGKKNVCLNLNEPITCGAIKVSPGDIVIADEEGILVVPGDHQEEILAAAEQKAARDEATSLETWRQEHQARIEGILQKQGFNGS